MSDEPALADRLEAKHVRLRTMNGSAEWIDTRWCAGCGGQTEWPCDPAQAAEALRAYEGRTQHCPYCERYAARAAELEAEKAELVDKVRSLFGIGVAEQAGAIDGEEPETNPQEPT